MPVNKPSCNKRFFVTGTDTDVGKTVITSSLLVALAQKGYSVLGLKPLASGARQTEHGLRNADAETLMRYSSIKLPYEAVNPVVFLEPAAPHFLAESLTVSDLENNVQSGLATIVDYVLVEGVGGWQVPLNDKEAMPDFVRSLKLPVIMVVGIRLGCLNHALLTAKAIESDGCQLLGWVGNVLDPDVLYLEEHITTLRRRLSAPLLGVVPHKKKPDPLQLAARLDVSTL